MGQHGQQWLDRREGGQGGARGRAALGAQPANAARAEQQQARGWVGKRGWGGDARGSHTVEQLGVAVGWSAPSWHQSGEVAHPDRGRDIARWAIFGWSKAREGRGESADACPICRAAAGSRPRSAGVDRVVSGGGASSWFEAKEAIIDEQLGTLRQAVVVRGRTCNCRCSRRSVSIAKRSAVAPCLAQQMLCVDGSGTSGLRCATRTVAAPATMACMLRGGLTHVP